MPISVAGVTFEDDVHHVSFPWGTVFVPSELRSLARLPLLRSATFCATRLDDQGLAEVVQAATIEVLDLQDTRISNDGLAHLSALPSWALRALSRRMPACEIVIKGHGSLP